MGSCRGASPSPSGRGWPEGPGEGRLVKNVAHSGPHPPLRGTLSRRERDSLQPLPTTANVQTPDHGRLKPLARKTLAAGIGAIAKTCKSQAAGFTPSNGCRIVAPRLDRLE